MSQLTLGNNGKQFIIKGITSYWAKVQTAVPKYKKPDEKQYEITLIIDEDTVDAMDDASFNKQPTLISTKNKKDLKKKGEASYPAEYEDQYLLKLTSPDKWPDGKDKPIKVVMDGKPFADNIGNGSVVDVIGRIGKKNDDGLYTVYLEKVNVTELVEYEDGEEFDFETKDEFKDFDDDDISF